MTDLYSHLTRVADCGCRFTLVYRSGNEVYGWTDPCDEHAPKGSSQ